MPAIQAIWFDLDDTLYDHTHSVCCGLDAIRRNYPVFGGRSSPDLAVLYNRALNAVYADHLRGKIDFREMRRRKLKLFYAAAKIEENEAPALDEFHHIYDKAYGVDRRATPGSVEILTRLAENGMRLAILTNGQQAMQEDKLRTIGLEWMIPNLLTSERAGIPKPDERIYQWALKHTGEVAGNVLMTGDSLENDVVAALGCGLSAALYAPGAHEQTVSTVHGMAPVISEWSCLPGLIGDVRAFSCQNGG